VRKINLYNKSWMFTTFFLFPFPLWTIHINNNIYIQHYIYTFMMIDDLSLITHRYWSGHIPHTSYNIIIILIITKIITNYIDHLNTVSCTILSPDFCLSVYRSRSYLVYWYTYYSCCFYFYITETQFADTLIINYNI